ncbi:HinT-interacting membrane complex lipoprotein P60 [Mesomycoplasma neurolyticum]|uniref:P60-like lipoprotein n=1 Tax=Mesomycoplasma neurolyticum TaxID=2120 RepID=A0A449A612_9BACT|nr:hypothetical protein [Mesomycoplasma neurolyticum]VEU59695.1 Uncharacterised protein [Mesomycoplasma neurolyticum]
MKKNKKIYTYLSFGLLFTPFIANSCGEVVTSIDRQKENQDLKSTEVKNYLENKTVELILKDYWYGKDVDLEKEIEKSESSYFKDAWKAFDFYQKYNLKKNPYYSWNIISELNKNNALSNDDYIKLINNIKSPEKLFSQEDFRLLFKLNNSNIKYDINKMLLNLNYLSKMKKENIEKSKKYKNVFDTTNNNNSKNKNIYENISLTSNDFFLISLLLNKEVAQVWNFESDEQNKAKTLRNIKIYGETSEKDFNNFLSPKTQNLEITKLAKDFELFEINDSIELKNLYGYKGILYNQNNLRKYDFSYSLNDLMRLPEIKSGFLNNEEKLILSKNNLINALKWKGKKELSVQIKENFDKNKDSSVITKNDLEIIKPKDVDGVKYEIHRILTKDKNDKNIDVLIKMTLDSNDSKNLDSRYYWVNNLSWDSTKINKSIQIPEEGKELTQYPDFISYWDSEQDKLFASYVLPIVPLYNNNILENNKNKIYFSLNSTPWESEENKIKLIHSLYLADENSLFNEALSFFEDEGYKIEYIDDIFTPTEDNKDNKKEN